MKNPHGVEPCKFMNKKDGQYVIECNPGYGPTFGNGNYRDIGINNKCNERGGWTNHGAGSYECHPKYRKSLFVGTAKPDESNSFKVSDYEVFTYN